MKNWFKKPTAQDLARAEYEEAQRELLIVETAVEQWTAKRSALLAKIARLGKVVQHG